VIGSWGSSLSMAGGPIFAEAKIPAVAVSATNPAVTKGNDYYFRSASSIRSKASSVPTMPSIP
jgi:amino acid/amide ABC transporter substrate-binding protein, HAAT family (TC 3.A.1.4.-)